MKFVSIAAIYLIFTIILVGSGIAAEKNIVDTAASDKNLSQLFDLVKTAGLVKLLNGTGPFTVFAPDNAAFLNMSRSDLSTLMNNTTQLNKTLTFHIVSGEITSKELKNGTTLHPVERGNITVEITPSGLIKVSGATVIKPDIKASNGIIHIINGVLLPK